MAILLLMAIICSCGSVLPLKDTSGDGLSSLGPDHPKLLWIKADSLEAPPMYPHPENFVFAKLGHCLARLHSVDEVLLPPQAIELYLAARVSRFD